MRSVPPLNKTPRHRTRGGLQRIGLCAWVFLLLAVGLAACTVSPLQQSQSLWMEGHYEEAVGLLQDASARDPSDRTLEAAYHRRRDLTVSQLSVAGDSALSARRLDEAQDLYQRARRLDPNSDRARDGLARIEIARRVDANFAEATRLVAAGQEPAAEDKLREILAQEPTHRGARRMLQQLREHERDIGRASPALKSALATPISVEFRDTPLRNVFEVLSRAAGLNFVFDHDLRTDTKISIFIRNNAIDDVLQVILSTNGLASKVLNDNTLLIYPNTPAKARDYQELVVRTFYLTNTDAKQVETMLRTMAHVKDIFVDEKINAVVIRDTADAVRLAERMVESIDIAEAEVMLELEVVEISRTRALNLGIQLPSDIQRESSSPVDSSSSAAGAAAGAVGRIATSNFGSLITTVPNPLLIANLYAQDTDANLLANPRIRVKNREKAKVLIGEKLPVITSTAIQNAGVASSVSYIDVGLKLEVEPQVYLDDEVGIKVQLEVNSNLGSVTVGSSSTGVTTAYQVGTRSAQTNLRLHDGETQVLAGLINDNESASWNKVPGLSDIPGIGRIFSNDNSTHEKTEIVLLVTPRIVRNIVAPEGDRLLMPAGTDAAVGARPLGIGPTAPRSLTLHGSDANPIGAQRGPQAGANGIPQPEPAADAPAPTPAPPAPATPAAAAAPAAPPQPLPPTLRGSPFPPAPGSDSLSAPPDPGRSQ